MLCKVTKIKKGSYEIFINHFRKFIIKQDEKKRFSGNFCWNAYNLETNKLTKDFISLKEAKEYCLSELTINKEKKHA